MSKFFAFFFVLLCTGLQVPSSFAHPVDRLEGLLCIYSDHLVEEREILNQVKPQNPRQEKSLHENKANVEQNILYVENLFKDLTHIKEGEKTLEEFLKNRLRERVIYLKDRTDSVLKNWHSRVAPIPTDPLMIKEQESFCEGPMWEKIQAKNDTVAWEYRQLIIKHTFDLVNKETLSQDTLTFLRVSPSLWDLLANKTQDLGYPDQAGAYGPFLFVRDLLPKNPYWVAIAIEWHNLVWGKTSKVHDEANVLTEQQWLDGYIRHLPHLDGELLRISIDESFITEPSLMLGAKPYTRISIHPLDKWGHVFPDISDLLAPKEEPLFVEGISFSQAMRAEKQTPSLPEDLMAFFATPSQLETPSEAEEQLSGDGEIFEEKEEEKAPKEFPASKKPAPQTTEKAYTFVFPRGLRLYRPDLAIQPFNLCQNPHKDVQEFVDTLFDPKKQCNVTFDEFAHHWKRIGGEIIGNRGGSHRQLIGPDKEPLFGTYDHGGFGKGTIGYLQAAFILQGYKPSQYDYLVIG